LSFYDFYAKFIFLKLISFPHFIIATLTNSQPNMGWMRRLQQILGRKHQRNLHVCNAHVI
jgi:hypothetical protein